MLTIEHWRLNQLSGAHFFRYCPMTVSFRLHNESGKGKADDKSLIDDPIEVFC